MTAPGPSPLDIVRRVLSAPAAPRGSAEAIDVGAHTGSPSAKRMDA